MDITPGYALVEFENYIRLNVLQDAARQVSQVSFSDKVITASVNASQAIRKNTSYMNALYRARMAA